MRRESRLQLEDAIEKLDELDREVIALRHFEQLTNVEVARVLELEESAASKRYFRALAKLRTVLGAAAAELGEDII